MQWQENRNYARLGMLGKGWQGAQQQQQLKEACKFLPAVVAKQFPFSMALIT